MFRAALGIVCTAISVAGWTHGNNSICGQGQWQRTCVWGAYCTGARKQLLFVLVSAGSAVS